MCTPFRERLNPNGSYRNLAGAHVERNGGYANAFRCFAMHSRHLQPLVLLLQPIEERVARHVGRIWRAEGKRHVTAQRAASSLD